MIFYKSEEMENPLSRQVDPAVAVPGDPYPLTHVPLGQHVVQTPGALVAFVAYLRIISHAAQFW